MDGSEKESGSTTLGDVSLREWLDRPGRFVEQLECMHIFRQVAEEVSLAHAQGVVVGNVRPSCFVMSAFSRVSFIESASCSTPGSDSSEELRPGLGYEVQVSSVEEVEKGRVEGGEGISVFPLKQKLVMEFNWYMTPEEAAGGASTFASDIYRLGVLLFELFCTFDSLNEKLRTMSNLRHRVLPPQLLLSRPKEASFCLWLLHPSPNSRPKMSEVLQSDFLNEPRGSLEERESAIKLREEMEEKELLLEFLLQLQQSKQEVANKLHDTICFLSADMEDVMSQQSILKKKGVCHSELENDEYSELLYPVINEDSACSGSKKRLRPKLQNHDEGKDNEFLTEETRSETHSQVQDDIMSKSSRLMKNFERLEAAYLSTRCRLMKSTHINSNGKGSITGTEGSSINELALKENYNGRSRSKWISPFLESLCKYLSFSKFKVRADLKQEDLLNSSNLVCSLGFDRDQEFFASAGVNRKIKVFECDMILNEDCDIHYPIVEMTSRSRFSSICWNGYIKSQIASSDFEGVVQVWDVSRSQVLMEMREHERRVWSVDFSLSDPTKLASGSDDGTVKLWNINQAGSIGTIKTKANVCSVQFQPDSGHSIAIGSADHRIYCYDLRNLRTPFCTLIGHTKTVSYVKYLDPSNLVSASTDNSLKLWDVSMGTSRVRDNPLQTFTGHMNLKNFVGLSISDGYVATGSETNEVFVYHKAFPMSVLSYKFNSEDPNASHEVDDGRQFISSVCWRGQSSTLLAANSSGNIKILEMI